MKTGERFTPIGLFTGIFIPDCIKRHMELTSTDKLVWGQLNTHAGKNGECYPKQSTIADEIGCSERNVIRSIQKLVDLKFLEIEKPTGNERLLHLNNRYYFIWNEAYNVKLRTCQNVTSASEKMSPPNKGVNNKGDNKPRRTRASEQKLLPEEKQAIPFIERFPSSFQQNENFLASWQNYINHRKESYPSNKLTDRAVTLMVNEIRRDCRGDINFAIEQINFTIKSGNRAPNFKKPAWMKDKEKQIFDKEKIRPQSEGDYKKGVTCYVD